MDPKRFRVEWISASEGKKYAEVVEEFTNDLKALGPQNTFRIKRDESERL
jgi:F420-non-reducing hydrogenase iron-sulfur subunit